MNGLRRIHRVLLLLQQRTWLKVLCSIIAIGGCTAYFAPLLSSTYAYESAARDIISAMTGPEGDRYQATLRETGSVKIDGTVRDVPADLLPLLYDDEGILLDAGFTMSVMLRDLMPDWAPTWLFQQSGTTWLFYLVSVGWLLFIVWMALLYPFLATCLVTSLAVAIAWAFGSHNAMFALGGLGLLLFSFVLLVRILSMALGAPNQVFAIAHTVLKEASRSKVSLIFIIVLLALLPLLPFWLDPDAPLRHRIQTFISRSVGMTFAICACMTIVLACATVAFEIRDRQIWQIMCKPVGKFRYVLGKWFGVVLLNASILLIAGVSTFLYIQYLRTTDVAEGVQGDLDRLAVREEVLTARETSLPIYDPIPENVLENMVTNAIENDPSLEKHGDTVPGYVERDLRRRFKRDLDFTRRTVGAAAPDGTPGVWTCTFTTLQDAVGTSSPLSLRYRFMIGSSDDTESYTCGFIFNEDPATLQVKEFVPTMSHFTLVPPSFVQPDGTMTVTILNMTPSMPGVGTAMLYFDEEDFELLYRVGGFEGNFLRAMLVMLVKLGFLAGLAVCCATFLSFPVACLASFTIFMAATLGPYLAYSLEYYVPLEANRVDWSNIGLAMQWIFESGIRVIAQFSVFMLEAFGEYRPTNKLVNGLAVTWGTVLFSFLHLAVIWSGLTLVVGYVVLRRRQLAIYSGGQA